MVPATMKAGDRKVYVIDGDVVQYADKSGIDVAKSDKSIVVCDAETGKYEYTSPDQLMNVGEPADPSTLSEAYMANERAKEAAANGEGTAEGNAAAESNAAANGDVSADGGKAEVVEPAYTDGSRVEINGHEYDVKSAGEKTVVLVDEHGKELAWTRSALDAKLESGDAEVLEPKAEAAPDVATEGLKAGDVFEDSDGNALTVKRVDGDKVVAVGADGKAQTYEDGTFEQMVESGVLKRETTDLNAAQTGSPEGDGVPAFGVGSVIELEGHEYKLLRVDKEDDTVYLENVEGETELWSYSGICIAFNEGDARLIDNKNYVLTDNQGNPVNENGTLKVEEVKSVDELTDEDFSAPTRNVQLPALPYNVDAAIGANGKPVIIKKNIFEKNWNAHRFPFEESRAILNAALYNTDLVGQTQPNNKPLHWVAIKIDDKSPIVVLEVNENKDNIEIVGWYTLDERNLNRIKRQAEKNGGELVMLSPMDKVESLSTPQTDLSSESKGTEQSSSVQVDVSENAPMPMRVVGKGKNAAQEEDWLATTPKRGYDYVFKESGLDAEEANAFVENKVAEAEKNLEKVKGKAPKMGTNIAAYKEAKADYEARVAEAQKAVDYWHAVKAERDKVLLEERRARKEKDKALYDDAVAQEEQRKAEMAQKAAEQEALGSNAVAPAIKEKWENAPKVDGGADEITLPNGEVVTGHYVLTESGAASASHQATNGFAETEGYPVDVNGETVNDRDYKRDAEAQQVTRGMAADYDSRALQSPVVVSGDGVVLSGNGRTMAGEIAALNGSDAKYNAYLRGHAGKFGFTTEQVEGFEHPRVVFVPDGEMPYTSETFAKFNQREQKSQSRTEMAVKLGKVVDDALFGRVMDVIGRHESLAEFYADDVATASVVKELADAGVIPQTEMAQLFDGGRLSESGQAMVEGVLVGKVFQGSPDAVRQITEVKSMRKAVMAALPEVVACHRLGGGYDLSKELAAAVDLVYKARKAGFKLGQHVSQHARQGNLFQLDDGATVADYNNAAVMMLADVMNDGRVTQLKKVLSFYNTQAADSAQGIGDMFAGGVKSKGQIINEVNELLNNGQEYDRRTPSVADGQGVGGEGGEQGDVAGPSHQGGEGSERGLSEAFDGLAAQLKTAEGEERKRVLGEMRDGIARFAEENGYPVQEFLLTREDFLAAVPEKDRAKYVEWLDDGAHMPAYYTKGKVYVYVEGCETFDKDVNETLAHEYTHADNAEFPENVNALTYALEDTHEVTRDDLREILREMSQGEHYDREAERLEAEGKDVNKMLADEVIAHAVARMVVEGEQVLDGITKNPTLQFIIKRAYKARENERQYNIRARENAERHDNASEGDNRGGSNNGANVEGESANGGVGRPVNGSEGGEVSSERGRSTVSEGKEVAAPSEDGAKVGVTDGEKSSATGDVMPSGKGNTPLSEKIATASAEVNTEPTEAQKEAGNYKKGHVQVGTFDITIEQPQGSVRKGTDADGKQWESKMNNTYGYIRGAVGVDGDHIDVFLSNDIDGWNGRKVFVVDQYNPDGSFDEHKVMLGFNDADEAKSDYLANYENGWENGRRIDVTAVNLEDFEKWIASSKRKTKPFGEYSSVKNGVVPSGEGKKDNLRMQKVEDYSAIDAEYFAAVERGDLEEAQRIVNEVAKRAGYSVSSDYQGTSAFNGAAPYGNGYFLTKEERKEAWDNGDFEGESTLGDYIDNGVDGGNLETLTSNSLYRHADDMRKEAIENVRDVIENGRNTITMYRSVPSSVKEGKFRNGDWITPSRKYAEDNAELHGWGKDYRVIEQEVPVDEVWFDGNDIAEWGYGREEDYVNDTDFAYKNTKNNRKSLDVITRDDEGNIIPPSKRFNSNKADERYQKGNSKKPLTEAERTLRDAITERLRESGLDVIGTEDGQRVLDMVNGDGAKEHRVYHGSGAEFDHFDHSHMGEGEGAQAYGWGTYVTEVKGIAEGYAKRSNNGIAMGRYEWQLKRAELESNINRAKEQLPFLRGEYKAEVEAQISEWEEQLKDYEPHNYLYTVEIPDDNGKNYLDWNAKVGVRLLNKVNSQLEQQGKRPINPELDKRYKFLDVNDLYHALSIRMAKDDATYNDDKAASEFLSSLGYAGIKYPADNLRGGRKDGAKNYVIFNENDAEITDHVRFFKTKNGEAYGFTVGGKIYYDPRIANAETPVHEYAHLWASALKANNAKEWKNVVDLMKDTNVWEEVKKTYPELETDDEIADEVLATYSGRRGAERLREEMRKAAAEGDGVMGKAEAVSALQRVKRAIDKFWKAVADFLHIHYTSAEEVADRVMKDLLDGVDPRSMMDGGKSLRPETRVNVVEAEAGHGFKNYAEAKTWAKEHIARTYSGEETGGKGDIRISNAAVDKYLSQSAVDKSESKDVHLAVLKVLPDVIRESVDAEQHADFKKGEDGVRSAENGVNPNVTIHRLYGAVRMDGKLYRVKVTLKENTRTKETPKAYSYRFTKIELLEGSLSQTEGSHNLEPSNSKSEVSAGQHGNVSGLTSTFPRYSDKSITAAKLLNGVEKSYDGGKFFEDYNKIREQFIGEKGAERADHADEVNTRLDNLGVAREMEAGKKDARAIKMATGWERGADGKWRYEMPDAKIKETMDIDGHVVKRFDEDMLWNDGKLADVVDAPELFKAYPQLKETRIVTDAVTGDMPSAGDYNAKTNTITIHADELKYMNGILNHEVQHAIQKIEGFARGGSPAMVRSEIKRQMAEVTKQVRQLRAEGKEAEAKELIKKNRGLYEASVGDDDFGSYKSLAGEVESRNVERRMGMSAEERRASLAAETEDVSREDQIFLTSGDGGRSYSLKDKAEKTLAGVHNISKDKLRKALKLGGLANPSVAVIDTEKQNHSGFGEISLVLPSNMVAKRTGRNAGTFFGDAWTPTYPQVERIFGKGGSDRAIADIASVPEEMQRMTRNAIDSFMDGKNADNLVYLYLQEKGIAPQLVKTKGVFSPDIRKEVISLTNRQPFYKLNETERNKVVELYIKYKFDGDRDAFEKALQERVANLIELQKEYTNPKSLLARKVKEHLENIDNYGYDYEAICRFVDDVNRDDKVSGEVSDVGTMQEARNIVEKENLQKDFEQWKEGLADRYNTKEVIFNGFTPSGNRRYVDNTLKNVSKIMKQKGRNGAEGFGFSFNNFAASIMQSNGTLKGIKERKAQLTQQHEDIDAFTDKWGEVYNHLADALNPNADISTMDVGYYRLQETAVQKKPKEYAKKEYGVELSDEDVQQLNDMVKAIREERPTMYFETKFERPVTLDEFAAAVVPKDLSADVRSGLEKAGLKLYDYDPKVEGDRKRAFDEAVHGDEGVLFRTSDELDQEYGSRWIDEQTNEDGRHTTQVKNTINSYKKFGDWVKRDSDGRNVDVLDASSGLGLGTEWLRENGINVEDVEPYPSENRTAPTYISYGDVKKKYDYIISNAVLNVIPDDWRANVLHNMADKLKVGGKLVINVRGAESIRKQGKEGETRITLDDPSEILVLRPNGSIKAYQKGFTKAELKEWCEKELGNGYSVEIANDKNAGGSYDTAVVVTKNNESGTIGVASEAGRPRRSAQALPSSNAKLDNNQKFANNLLVLSENLSERDMGAHEFLFNVAKAFGLNGQNLNKSFYQDLSNSVGIRISDHSANTDNITNRNVNDDVYGLVVKLSKNRFKSRSDANYLEYVYYPDKLTGERQREIVEGLNKFLQTGDYMQLPAPDRVNRSGKFDVLIDGRETSPTAKHQAANDLARQMHVEGEVEVVTSTDGLTGRQAKAKGWYDVRTGRVTIVLPNNKNAADVRETVFHEVVAHKGLRNLVGEEHFNTFLDNVYNNAEEGIKQTIDEMAEKKYNGDKRKATEEYMAHLAEDGEFVKPENQGFFAKVRDFLTDLLRKVGIKLGFKLTDNDLRYILWRSWKGLAERDGGSVFEKAEDVKMQHELGQTDEARSASGENGIMFREGSDELKDVVEKMKADVERLHEGELDDLRSGARAIGGRLSELNKAMRLQRAYDMSTVASVTELAKTMLKNGLLSEMLPSNATSNGGDASRVHRDFKAKVHRLTCN
ncbi:LPD23 domain-containing protein [Prevotellamassilia timonensis]|uniref:LPD3 domain-containing protein n=1 Tax=Prevotellamassilia timonensis TaxID=1852370 RepID=UPI00307AE46B